jgi:hypothetical protein
MQKTLDEQREMGFGKPQTLFVDTAYVSAAGLATATAEKRELVGPVMPSHPPQGGYSVEEFRVDIAHRRAICPAGQRSTQCSRIEDRFNRMVEYRFEWSWKCGTCSLRGRCLGSKQKHRTIRVRDNFMYLQARREEMKTDAFKEKMKRRAGIEGTISELVRGYGSEESVNCLVRKRLPQGAGVLFRSACSGLEREDHEANSNWNLFCPSLCQLDQWLEPILHSRIRFRSPGFRLESTPAAPGLAIP